MSFDKKKQAIDIIKSCIGKNGVWASTDRYAYQCWTRDFCIATSYLFLYHEDLKNLPLVQKHLFNIVHKRRDNGKLPILFLDNKLKFLEDKIDKSIKCGKKSFMLERYLKGELKDLTPHTRDSEILFISTVCDYLLCYLQYYLYDPLDTHLVKGANISLNYVEKCITTNGLIHGADWRDVRLDLDDKTVLTNACLLYQAYTKLTKVYEAIMTRVHNYEVYFPEKCLDCYDKKQKAEHVKDQIQKHFWNGTYFVDYPETDKFDLLGNSLAISCGIASDDQRESIFNYVTTLTGPHGIKTTETFLPPLNDKEKEVMDRDGAVIWPFTNGFMLEAMLNSGSDKWINYAVNEFKKWEKLDGFYEWYDIVDGNGYGSVNQVWSAALYLRVKNIIDNLPKP
ncbi:glycogen debranching enzyme alpha-1,6-glucosidase [Tupanvirus soda lake]|uniref:Glycogen debranching enzyme alpha-1,6-glucosidase n=2 Tax=Tupanvirus TaxID=2094720 RepID=A0A6N1NSN5_9VIRU|nr:glycogen debranching enzyme alpha-1,6-glucosidase [Tupanvirus soda lake]QKU34736.1 glycogen debranching enzyme alpha-1,6-glucosidase [Tupanvirus soda lake]